MQEYIRETGACLIQLGQAQDKAAQAKMEKLTVEASRLLGCIKLLNHDVHKAMLDGKLDPSLANTHRLGTAFYTSLTVSPVTSNLVMYLHFPPAVAGLFIILIPLGLRLSNLVSAPNRELYFKQLYGLVEFLHFLPPFSPCFFTLRLLELSLCHQSLEVSPCMFRLQ